MWLVILAALTTVGVVWLRATGLGPGDFSPAILVIGYSPALAALIAYVVVDGRAGLAQMGAQLARWRVGIRWYIAVLVAPLVLLVIAHLLDWGAAGPAPSTWLDVAGVGIAAGSFVASSIGEEPGWRGLGHAVLRTRFGLILSGVLVGVLWATWHNWPVFVSGTPESALDIGTSFLRLVSTAIIYGWIWDATRGSLVLLMVAHFGHNLAVALLPPTTTFAQTIIAIGYAIVAIVVIVQLLRTRTPARRTGTP